MPDLSGIFDEIGKTARTIQEVNLAKQELSRKQQMFDTDQKIKNLEINKMRMLGLADEGYIQSQEKQLKLQSQMQNNAFELMNSQLEDQLNASKNKIQTVGAYTTGMVHGAKSAIDEQSQEQQMSQSSGQVGLMTAPSKPAGVMSYGGQDYRINPFTGKIDEVKSDLSQRREERISKQNELMQSTKIREEFINRPEIKDYITINTQVKSMDSLLDKAKSGGFKNKVALDQALISMYNKLTDPTSVVRESEYARTPENLPLINRIQGAITKIEQGGAGLTNADREALVKGAKIISDERGTIYNDTLSQYENLAGQYGIEPSLITRGLPKYNRYYQNNNMQNQTQQEISGEFNTPEEAENANLPVGSIVMIGGRKARID